MRTCLLFLHFSDEFIHRIIIALQYQLKKPDGVQLNKKNDFLPFDNITPVERFAKKYNASLFAFVSHNKKRPNNVVLGEC